MTSKYQHPVDFNRELASFSENMLTANFKAIHKGIGLGTMNQGEEKKAKSKPPILPRQIQPILPPQKNSKHLTKISKKVGFWFRCQKAISSHIIDLAVSLVVVVLTVFMISAAMHVSDPSIAIHKKFVDIVSGSHPLFAMAALYFTYFVYVLLFKILVGFTLGSKVCSTQS